MPFCTNCGNNIVTEVKFCPSCGAIVVQTKQKQPQTVVNKKEERFTKEGRKIIDAGPKPGQNQPTSLLPPPISKPPKKKKKGCLGCLGKSLLIIFVLLIVGVIIIWNIPDDWLEESVSETGEQITTPVNFEKLNVDLGFSKAVVGDLKQNGIQLDIPKKTFDQKIQLQVKTSDAIPSFNKKRANLIGTPYEISINQKSKRLNKPVVIKLKLNKQEISRLKHSEDLWIGYFNGKQWDYFKPLEVNVKNEYVKFETYHFSPYTKAKPTNKERIDDFAYEAAVKQWANKTNNAPTKQATEQIVRQILNEKLGINNKSMTQDIVESIMNENDYSKLLVSYNDNKMDQFGQDLAILAGKKIVEVVTNNSNAKTVLGAVTKHASKVGTGVQIAVNLYEGKLEEAAKNLSMEIIGSFPMTKLFREAAKITDQQIVRWRDNGVEAAYKVFVNGAQSNIPWWGYEEVEPGNFEDVWSQMKGLKVKLLDDAKKKYAKAHKIKVSNLGTRALDIIEEQTKENLKQKFIKREKQEREIEKIKQQQIKLIEVFEDAKLLREGRFGYTDYTSFDFRLERLFRIKDMILKDTKSKVGFSGINEGGIISAKRVARLIQIWYNPDEGKKKYREELIKLGYIDNEEFELADGPWEFSVYEAHEFYDGIDAAVSIGMINASIQMCDEKDKPQLIIKRDEMEIADKKDNSKAIKKLNAEYEKSLEFGFVNAPSAKYEKMEEELLFLYKYNPVQKNGIFTFTIQDVFDLEEGEEMRFILQLKSENYFEAKVFYNSKAFVNIIYFKGKLKE